MQRRKKSYLTVLLLIGAMTSGCAGIKNTMRLSEKDSQWNPVEQLKELKLKKSRVDEEEPNPPVTMTVLWKESVYHLPGKPSVRGFGGRVFFYDQFNNAVPAKGELVVYGFDDSDNLNDPTVADKRFEFTNDELESLYGDTGLGPSYSIWCPWDKVGGMRKTVALIPMFKTEDDRVIKSGQSIGVLPGKVEEVAEANDQQPYKVLGSSPAVFNQRAGLYSDAGKISQVTFHQDEGNLPKQKIKTSTIRMTPAMSQRLASQHSRQHNSTIDLKEQNEVRLPGADAWKFAAAQGMENAQANNSSKAQARIDELRKKMEQSEKTEDTPELKLPKPRVFGVPGALN